MWILIGFTNPGIYKMLNKILTCLTSSSLNCCQNLSTNVSNKEGWTDNLFQCISFISVTFVIHVIFVNYMKLFLIVIYIIIINSVDSFTSVISIFVLFELFLLSWLFLLFLFILFVQMFHLELNWLVSSLKKLAVSRKKSLNLKCLSNQEMHYK